MGPKPTISLENRGKIIALAEEQYPHREIAARVGYSHGAVGEIVRKHRLTGSVTDRKIPGRGRKTTARQDKLLVRKSLADRFKTAPQVKAEMLLEHGVDISTSTAQRRLRVGCMDAKPEGSHASLLRTREHGWNLQGPTKTGQLLSGPKLFSATSLASCCTGVMAGFT